MMDSKWFKKFFSGAFAGFVLLSLLCSTVVSCKSTPKDEFPEVNPIALLDSDSSIYVRIPVSKHVELAASIASSALSGISTSDAKLVAEHLDLLYAGLGTVSDRSRLQVAAKGNFPSFALNSVLTKRNGWLKDSYEAVSTPEALSQGFPSKFTVYSRTDLAYRLSFCSASEIALATNVNPMLERYAQRLDPPEEAYAQWLDSASEDVLFYITRPGQYLRNLIGITMNGCESVYGSMVYVPQVKNSSKGGLYQLNMYIELSDKKFMRSFLGALNLAFGMMGGNVEQVDNTTIYVSDLEISESQIIDLFTRDPITGKHFRVEGDLIITE